MAAVIAYYDCTHMQMHIADEYGLIHKKYVLDVQYMYYYLHSVRRKAEEKHSTASRVGSKKGVTSIIWKTSHALSKEEEQRSYIPQ